MPPSNTDLKKFAQSARLALREQVAARLEQVLRTDSAVLREREDARRQLVQQIAETSKQAVIDRVAYTWFNRLCALRFMDANHYNRIGVVSPAEGFTQPEILQEAKGGYIDEALLRFVDFQTVYDLLSGSRPSTDPQQEAYRLLLVGACNALHRAMPFLFEPIADYSELLMPQDLLSEHSILHALRQAMTAEACQDVEVIGWLYQFYISERKDEVFAALKQNQKIAPEDIPAATQLFTPHWIVRYLVENSLGRLWLLNRPTSRLAAQMDYYIQPVEPETDFLRVDSPEEIKVCDPACGSGHMLTYAFDLLYAIYEEEGYPAADIPRLILTNNLYGIEIDERAGDLAAFALVMKARGKDRRFFTRGVQPNICVLENIRFTDQELEEYATAVGRDLFTEPLLQTLKQFEQAKNFGSLIQPLLQDDAFIHKQIQARNISGNLFLYDIHARVMKVLKLAEYLAQKYHVVVANPPYMGTSGMNDELREYIQNSYPKSKPDLFAAFIERNLYLLFHNGLLGMITMQTWMFLPSFIHIREIILNNSIILTMAHLGAHAFDSIGGEIVSTTAFILGKTKNIESEGIFIRLTSGRNEQDKEALLSSNLSGIDMQSKKIIFFSSAKKFLKIPDNRIVYWLDRKVLDIFERIKINVGNITISDGQTKSGDNDRFLRQSWEVSRKFVGSNQKWRLHPKGGGYRKWYGNVDWIIDWSDTARIHYRKDKVARILPEYLWGKSGISWSMISSEVAFRVLEHDHIFNIAAPSIFPISENDLKICLGLLNSEFSSLILKTFNPSKVNVGEVQSIPFPENINIYRDLIETLVSNCINISCNDWNNFETAWDFNNLCILKLDTKKPSISETFALAKEKWKAETIKLMQHERDINDLILKSYELTNVITTDIRLNEISLICNPHYRYGGNRSEAELEALLLADTMREFISYAVGCMFGRYSLDKPGLILANQGETLQDYLRQIPDPTFLPDEDNAIPILEGEWFSDDVCERFKKFLRVTFGEAHYEENLAFIENAVGRDIRSYFLKEFYSQHVKMYQKRPIYWLFSSPRGSFNVLIYMHRYRPDTLSVILNRYLREFRAKLEGRKSHLEQVSISAASTQREKTAALKEIESLNKTLEELRVYERDALYPLAAQGIQIDLDDGVKVNYKKFGKALAKISGLSE